MKFLSRFLVILLIVAFGAWGVSDVAAAPQDFEGVWTGNISILTKGRSSIGTATSPTTLTFEVKNGQLLGALMVEPNPNPIRVTEMNLVGDKITFRCTSQKFDRKFELKLKSPTVLEGDVTSNQAPGSVRLERKAVRVTDVVR